MLGRMIILRSNSEFEVSQLFVTRLKRSCTFLVAFTSQTYNICLRKAATSCFMTPQILVKVQMLTWRLVMCHFLEKIK